MINILTKQIKQKKSCLCVGLDTDINKIPHFLLNEKYPLFEFNKAIVDVTSDYCIAYKVNVAFYEALGSYGWEQLELTADYIKTNYPYLFLIADAKRGDIGNTSEQYAKAFFENLPFDAITISPYMGYDSIAPFLKYDNKVVILLALTSNKGAEDFQLLKLENNRFLFEHVLLTSKKWSNPDKIFYVVGATKAEYLQKVRSIIPENFILVPGIGAQGGNLEEVIKYGINSNFGIMINSSRSIIYASNNTDFEIKARDEAQKLSLEIYELSKRYFNFEL